MTGETAARQDLGLAIDAAFRADDLDALLDALGNPADFPNCRHPFELGVGDHPLEYAVYWSSMAFIERLLSLGADPNYGDDVGFPALIAALSSGRRDALDIVKLLLDAGAELNRRGLNGWTPLHYAVNQKNLDAVRLLLERGADPEQRTWIDDRTSALEDAESSGFDEAVTLMREALAGRGKS